MNGFTTIHIKFGKCHKDGPIVTLPLVSVITPTWKRRSLLLDQCIPSVQRQTYANLEHIIVVDGPGDLSAIMALLQARLSENRSMFRHPIRIFELEKNYGLWGNEAKRRAIAEFSDGELIAYLDDDDTYEPPHIEILQRYIGTGFAYSVARTNWLDGPEFIGQSRPTHGNVTNSALMHRRELIKVANWRDGPGWYINNACPDWDLINRWMKAGITWTFIKAVTVNMRPYVREGIPCRWHDREGI